LITKLNFSGLPIKTFFGLYNSKYTFSGILFGDMSIVGPRPALWNQNDLIYERDKYLVNKLKPGLTGWAQINGRDTLSICEKAKYDSVYLVKQSFLFDLYIVIKTFQRFFHDPHVVEGSNSNINDSL
jgi:O-antigen biosynthesis protein WbqP